MQSDRNKTTDRDRDAWGAALEKYVDQHGGCVPTYTADFGEVGLIAIAAERERCARQRADHNRGMLPWYIMIGAFCAVMIGMALASAFHV